jgi:hypothetical protein
MRNFINHDNIFTFAGMGILSVLLIAGLIGACFTPDTPEEKVEMDTRYVGWVKEDLVTVIPEPGVKCFILKGNRSSEPRTMSCVVLPAQVK